jgi:seryl-tRNA synthetase
MLDIKFIRENPDKVKEGLQKRGENPALVDKVLEADKRRREFLQKSEKLRFQRKKLSNSAQDLEEAKKIKIAFKEVEQNLKEAQKQFEALMYQLPNLPLANVPFGRNEKDNVVVKTVGEIPRFDFPVKDYLEIAKKFDLIDTERAAKTSGTRFGFLKRELVLMEFALVRLAIDSLLKEGFIPLIPPVMIKPEMMRAMGYIDTPADLEERYFLEKDNLVLVGTSEQVMGPMHQGEIFEEKDLPRRYVGFSSCFRREAGSYGKDTKGILRVHQFDKVEMFSFERAENSEKEHQFLIKMAENLIAKLGLPYRLVQLCTADLARPSAVTFDIEVWLPGQGCYRETNSISNCTDFQARRLNIRYKKRQTNKLEFVHTLNGTAFAIGRILIAIIENYQQKNGKIKVPKALLPYLDFEEIPR